MRSRKELRIKGRREFIKSGSILGASLMVVPSWYEPVTDISKQYVLRPTNISGLTQTEGPDHLPDAKWYAGANSKDGFEFKFEKGLLANMKMITTDMLAEGTSMIKFNNSNIASGMLPSS